MKGAPGKHRGIHSVAVTPAPRPTIVGGLRLPSGLNSSKGRGRGTTARTAKMSRRAEVALDFMNINLTPSRPRTQAKVTEPLWVDEDSLDLEDVDPLPSRKPEVSTVLAKPPIMLPFQPTVTPNPRTHALKRKLKPNEVDFFDTDFQSLSIRSSARLDGEVEELESTFKALKMSNGAPPIVTVPSRAKELREVIVLSD